MARGGNASPPNHRQRSDTSPHWPSQTHHVILPTILDIAQASSIMAIGLPVETLIAIFEEVDDVQDLCHLRMANRALCAITTPLAFSSLSVITTSSSAQNIGRLFDLPDIAAHVKEVSYHDKGANIECDASSPSISLRQYHDLSMPLHMRGGRSQLELTESKSWPVCFLAFTSCSDSKPST